MDELSHIFFAGDNAPTHGPSGPRAPSNARRRRSTASCHQRPVEQGDSDPFLTWLFAQAGLDAAAYRPGVLQRRLAACLRHLGARSTAEAAAALMAQPERIPGAIGSVLIGVSEFFRDSGEFDLLEREVLPSMLRYRPCLRVLSVGCAEGHELYSIAMLLDEFGCLQDSRLLGLDCRPEAIERARRGVFDAQDLACVAAHRRGRHFAETARGTAIRPELRECLAWQVADLLRHAEPSVWDMILFRNVAIYLSEPDALWERLVGRLAPGGILMTGRAELPPPSLPVVRLSRCVFRKMGHA